MSQVTVHAYDKFPFFKWDRTESRRVEEAAQDLKDMLGKSAEISTRVTAS